MYWFRKSIEPVSVIAPGLGSFGSCANAGALVITTTPTTATTARALRRTPYVTNIDYLR